MKRNRGYRRSVTETHIKRKKNICNHIYGWSWYKNDNQYSKNKVYCSCWMCRSYHQYLEGLDLKSWQDKMNCLDEDVKVRIPNRYTRWHGSMHSKGWK